MESDKELITHIKAKFKIMPADSTLMPSDNIHMYLGRKWSCISWNYSPFSSSTRNKEEINDHAEY
jgi:hypothetical protein